MNQLMKNSWVIRDNSCSLKKLLVLIFGCLTLLVCCSCGSTKVATQLVKDIRVDTVYLSSQQYDSIYIYKDRLTDRSNDTVYVKDISVEYKYRMLHDTIKVVQKDSIPYEVTKIVTKVLTRPLTWFDHLTRSVFWLIIGILFVIFLKTACPELCRRLFKLKNINL